MHIELEMQTFTKDIMVKMNKLEETISESVSHIKKIDQSLEVLIENNNKHNETIEIYIKTHNIIHDESKLHMELFEHKLNNIEEIVKKFNNKNNIENIIEDDKTKIKSLDLENPLFAPSQIERASHNNLKISSDKSLESSNQSFDKQTNEIIHIPKIYSYKPFTIPISDKLVKKIDLYLKNHSEQVLLIENMNDNEQMTVIKKIIKESRDNNTQENENSLQSEKLTNNSKTFFELKNEDIDRSKNFKKKNNTILDKPNLVNTLEQHNKKPLNPQIQISLK